MMFTRQMLMSLAEEDLRFASEQRAKYEFPVYGPESHYLRLTDSRYYQALLTLRHYIKASSDYYFGIEQKAKNIDLFMITPTISSPMGPGSDSEAIPIKFGTLDAYLVDSSQFGFEPLLMNGFDKVYCYLPSMRGEDADKRHLNQFFHCEAEIRGGLDMLIPIIEGYIKMLCQTVGQMQNIVQLISKNPAIAKKTFRQIAETKVFPKITFDEAVNLLLQSGMAGLVNETLLMRDITARGEIELFKILNLKTPLWVTNYDRDRVPFYQKPDPANKNKVINADLLFPPLIEGSFGGEIVGCGQRQDSADEMYESLRRQNVSSAKYEWYINLRNLPGYATTSGFGLGIERFIAWALCMDDIKNVIIYPRIKNVLTYP